MLLDGFFETLSEFTGIIKKKFRNIYQNSSLYEKKCGIMDFMNFKRQ